VWVGAFSLSEKASVMMVNMIKRVWIEPEGELGFDPYQDSADVMVEVEDGQLWSAAFVTVPYLQRQMYLSGEMAAGISETTPPVRFVALETPHVIVENLLHDTIEDTIDYLMTLGIFESVFVHHTDDHLVTGS
jgi:hypothetical protein